MAPTGSRRVLIASYHFPPDSAVGALRPARFARLLPDFDWECFALTVDDSVSKDPASLQGLERVRIYRVPDPAGSVRRTSRNAAASKRPRRGDGKLRQAMRREVAALMPLLDGRKAWAIRATLEAVRLIRRHQIDCLITSSPPSAVHMIGLAARVFTEVRWVADLRDPWLESLEGRSFRARSCAADWLERRLECAVVARADRVVTTSSRTADALRERYPWLSHEKLLCVRNGIDTDILRPGQDEPKYQKFTIAYAGSLYEGRTPEPVFQALAALLKTGKIGLDDVAVKLVGYCRIVDGEETLALARRHGVERCVEVLDQVPRAEAMTIMRRAHLLLAIVPSLHRLIIPAKLYDYLASGTPILALTEESATSEFLREVGRGRCVPPYDITGLGAYLLQCMSSPESCETPAVLLDALHSLEGRHLTGRLAAEMSRLCPRERVIQPATS